MARNEFLSWGDFDESVVAIKINKTYYDGMPSDKLYDYTRGCWKRKIESVNQADYALCVVYGIVKEVYRIDRWVPASEAEFTTRKYDPEKYADRIAFIGDIAENGIRNKYIGKSVTNLYKNGEADPLKVFLKAEGDFTMTKWLISANPNSYDHSAAFAQWGYVDWIQYANFKIGDIVYIYSALPIGRIRFKTEVIRNDMAFSEIEDDSIFWKMSPNTDRRNAKYSRLKLISEFDIDSLSLSSLRDNGLKNAPQRAIKLSGNVLDYIESQLVGMLTNEDGINTPLSPINKFRGTNGHMYYTCARCGDNFIKSPRCPICGQLVKETN